MTDSAAVVDVSRYYPGSGQREALLDAMRRVASEAAAADGCFGAQVCGSDQDGEALVRDLAVGIGFGDGGVRELLRVRRGTRALHLARGSSRAERAPQTRVAVTGTS
jgi:hypothetical protein